jgi:hypothetical protein
MVFFLPLAMRKTKMEAFFVTIAPWQMPVRHSLRNLQRCGAFIAAFTSEKRWMKK